jgi:CheY-like chemotaxis protein
VALTDVARFVERSFAPVAEEKGLVLAVDVRGGDLPPSVVTDGLRLQQVLKNLLSNAVKFTEHGSVTLTVRRAEPGRRFGNPALDTADGVIAFSVSDTGIGIPRDKLRVIFEAFQQADGTTSRRYGGTGLGLSISREIARLLGGEIRVESTPGVGSTFTLFLPLRQLPFLPARDVATLGSRVAAAPPLDVPRESDDLPRAEGVDDDRDALADGDRVVLVIESDPAFARVLRDMARGKGFRALVALDGEAGLRLAHRYGPDAVTLDIDIPGGDGLSVLDRLKRHPDTRHIPVHIISGADRRQQGLRLGAIAWLDKPADTESLDGVFTWIARFIDRRVKRLLVVEDDPAQRTSIVELIRHDDVEITAVDSAQAALGELEAQHFDCMVLDLGLPGMSGFELLERVKDDAARRDLPIIIYTGREISEQEEMRLRQYAETIIVKDVHSPERLLDETALFLHRVEAELPVQKRRMLEQLHSSDERFLGRRILVVDDDVRNVFSLTSVLEAHGMEVSFAESGQAALDMLQAGMPVELVLMDVMMPGMDGYDTIRAMRERPELSTLPIIALTAKAMKGDREKCIEAGASDYITKPVDTDQLLSLLRVWLYQ